MLGPVLAKLTNIERLDHAGRLDLERALASPPSHLQVAAIDMLDPSIVVVDQAVTYEQVLDYWNADPVPPNAALMFCWGTKAPWEVYVQNCEGPLVLVFSGIDPRVESHPNPSVVADIGVFTAAGFQQIEVFHFKAPALWLGECKLTIFARTPRH
jgi:hypothetical protein